jgi:predicted DNA-binding transcriptional regulator AlpA
MKARDMLTLKVELRIRSTAEFCRRLGISHTTFYRWMEAPDQDLPAYFGMAAAALRHGMEPYQGSAVSSQDLAFYGGDLARRVFNLIDNAPTHEAEMKSRAKELLPPGS